MIYNNENQLEWLNESQALFNGDKITMVATKGANLFCTFNDNGEKVWSCFTAPVLYTEKDCDFVASVKVRADFKNTFDSACLVVIDDENLWAKACFEKTDFDTVAVVSVVNNMVSDDCNGCNINNKDVWLKVARKGRNIGFYYSCDGKNYYMMRNCYLPLPKTVKVGIASQCPMAEGTTCYFEDFVIDDISVDDLRKGE